MLPLWLLITASKSIQKNQQPHTRIVPIGFYPLVYLHCGKVLRKDIGSPVQGGLIGRRYVV